MPHKRKRKSDKEVSILKIGKKKRRKLQLNSKLKKKYLMIKNLSYKATEKDVKKYLKEFGKISSVELIKKSNGNLTGRGVIEFGKEKAAVQAIQNCNGKEFMGRKIVLDWITPESNAKTKSKKSKKKKQEKVIKVEENEEAESETEEKPAVDVEIKSENGEMNRKKSKKTEIKSENGETNRKKSKKTEIESENGETKMKKSKKAKSVKKGRLILRNLSFKITEADITNHFKKFGDITEVTLLRRKDGKLVGCGFVQFKNKNCAAKAILECNSKPLLGRPVVVDWAVPKSTFKENEKSEEVKIKKEPDEDDEEEEEEEEQTKPSSDDEVVEVKQESESEEENDNDSDDAESDTENDDDDDDSDDTEEMDKDKHRKGHDEGKQKVMSNDISEGRTVFIKNVPFSATNEDLKSCMEQFGPVIYALVCIDPNTEHSKGTAFVKFQKKDSAEECLSAGTELVLHGQTLDPHRALNREDVHKKAVDKHKDKGNKDSRNLYLVKEGVVVAGSKAAAGVSMTDMSKRLQLEQSKSQLLRNLNMYVSPVRLIVHNLPPTWTDAKLRQLFAKHGGAGAVIKEARVMRDLKNVDAEGVGKSKEFGFVTFTRHENSLNALRSINNNPDIFTPARRPIVSFSIENKAIMNIKQKRLEKSQARNPLYPENRVKAGKKKQGENKKVNTAADNGETTEEKEPFVGVTSKPGKVKMRNRFKLQTQAKIHSQMVHKAKLKQKKMVNAQQKKQIAKEKMKEPQMKKGKKRKLDEEDGAFSSLVNKYKKQLEAAPLKKWYE